MTARRRSPRWLRDAKSAQLIRRPVRSGIACGDLRLPLGSAPFRAFVWTEEPEPPTMIEDVRQLVGRAVARLRAGADGGQGARR